MNVRIALLLVGGLLGLSQVAEAQLTQIGRDYRQPMTYSPDDPFAKGWVYRLQTGQAGKYFNCDGEEAKRYSPYIYWQTVCNHTYPVPYCRVLLRDIHEVKERVRAGACRGGQNCQCEQCSQYAQSQPVDGSNYLVEATAADRFAGEAAAMGSVSGSAEVTVTPTALAGDSEHVVYGSRSTRQQAARQGSFADPEATNGGRMAERETSRSSGGSQRR
jgi:hypothetical protein